LGIALSDVALVSVVLAGLSVIAQTFGSFFFVIRYAGAVYLIVLGYQMWRTDGHAKGQMPAADTNLARQVVLGAAIGFGNPKAILFHASLMPLILDITQLDMFGITALLTTVLVVNIISMGSYAVLSGASSRWFRTPGSTRIINRLAGGTMIGTGVLIVARD
jgi:threonine/homoserine/homoserine lactone efflux protein